MICQGIYPYRSNSWRIFSHWIEKRISPPLHPTLSNPLLGIPTRFLVWWWWGGGKDGTRGRSLCCQNQNVIPCSSLPIFLSHLHIDILSLFFFSIFQFGRFWGERRMRPGQMDHHCFMFRPPSFSSILKKIHLVGRHRNIGWMLDHYQMTLRFFSNS